MLATITRRKVQMYTNPTPQSHQAEESTATTDPVVTEITAPTPHQPTATTDTTSHVPGPRQQLGAFSMVGGNHDAALGNSATDSVDGTDPVEQPTISTTTSE